MVDTRAEREDPVKLVRSPVKKGNMSRSGAIGRVVDPVERSAATGARTIRPKASKKLLQDSSHSSLTAQAATEGEGTAATSAVSAQLPHT